VTAGGTPQAVVIAGPNGAGKTSAAPDLLAGRIMLRRLHELAQAREDFAFESTLDGRSAYRLLTGLAGVGYDVHIFHLRLPSPDLAVARVRRRVKAGGRPLIAQGTGARASIVLDEAKWLEIRKRIEEVA